MSNVKALMNFKVTFITINNKRRTITVQALNIQEAMAEAQNEPDYDMLVEAMPVE